MRQKKCFGRTPEQIRAIRPLKDGVITDNPVIEYKFDVVKINDEDHLLLQDRDIMYVFEGEEEVKTPSEKNIYIPKKEIIY